LEGIHKGFQTEEVKTDHSHNKLMVLAPIQVRWKNHCWISAMKFKDAKTNNRFTGNHRIISSRKAQQQHPLPPPSRASSQKKKIMKYSPQY
jgi:hypothetical protein